MPAGFFLQSQLFDCFGCFFTSSTKKKKKKRKLRSTTKTSLKMLVFTRSIIFKTGQVLPSPKPAKFHKNNCCLFFSWFSFFRNQTMIWAQKSGKWCFQVLISLFETALLHSSPIQMSKYFTEVQIWGIIKIYQQSKPTWKFSKNKF